MPSAPIDIPLRRPTGDFLWQRAPFTPARPNEGDPRLEPEIAELQRLIRAMLVWGEEMIALLRQVSDPGSGEGKRWAQMRTHRIMTDMMVEPRQGIRHAAVFPPDAEW